MYTDDELEPILLDAPPARQSQRIPLRVLSVIAALVAVIGASLVATSALSSNGGPSMPDAAVQQLLAAAGDNNLQAAIGDLVPAESQVLQPGASSVASQLERLGILASGTDLSSIPGFTLQFAAVTTSTTMVTPDVADVRFTGGTVRAAADPAKLPIGSAISQTVLHGHLPPAPPVETEPLSQAKLVITTLRQDGVWRVSLLYTLAENLRLAAGLPAPAFGEGIDSVGASTPAAVLQGMLTAAGNLNVRQLVELVSPVSGAVLHDYIPLVLTEINAGVLAARVEGVKVSFSNLETTTVTDGDAAKVTITGLDFTATVPHATVTGSYANGCLTVAVPARSISSCGLMAMAGIKPPASTVDMVRINGAWYLDPTSTFVGGVEAFLQALPSNVVSTIVSARGHWAMGLRAQAS
jgi:hypothetical protein